MHPVLDRRQLRSAAHRTARLLRRRTGQPVRRAPRRTQQRRPRQLPPVRVGWHLLRPLAAGLALGILTSALLLWTLQWALPQGQYYTRIQIPLARLWGLQQGEALGWSSYAEALVRAEQPTRALQAYGLAIGQLDTRPDPASRELRNALQAQMDSLSRGKSDVLPLSRPPWGSALLQLAREALVAGNWRAALVFYPLVQEPPIAVMLVLSLWLSLSFVFALQDQMAWTRILDQERFFSLGRLLPPALGAGLLALLIAALVTFSPSQPAMVAVVCGAAVPGLFVQILNRAYQIRARRALAAWESQHRAEFSSELHNTAQQSIMSAQVVLREIIQDLEISDEPEAGHYAWRLAEAMERCQEVEDELRVLRNGTEDKFARGQNFVAAIEPICDRLNRRDVDLSFQWRWEGQPVEAATWESRAFDLAGSARDRRIAATLYQVLSELTWNVLKYACLDSEQVRVEIIFTGSRQSPLARYSLEVSDNGPGFDVQSAEDRRPHSGIFSLERYLRRVEIVGAQATSTLHTAPGEGTRVFTEIVATQRK